MNFNKADQSPKLDLKLNLSPPRPYNNNNQSPNRSSVNSSSMEIMSPPSSCVSSDQFSPDRSTSHLHRPSSPAEVKSMMLVGCPQCLMYVMLAEEDPKCPKCKSTVLLEITNHEEMITKNTKK